jgi:hypothetical protein
MGTDRPERDVVDEAMAAILRKKTEAERLAIANGMWKFARQMIRQNLAVEHPDWTATQIQRETARRLSHGTV